MIYIKQKQGQLVYEKLIKWIIAGLVVGVVFIGLMYFSGVLKWAEVIPDLGSDKENIIDVTELPSNTDISLAECLKEPVDNLPALPLPCLNPSHEDPVLKKRLDSVQSYITLASEKYGVDENLIKAIIAQESDGIIKIQNKNSGCKGLMQVCLAAAQDVDKYSENKGLNLLSNYKKNPYDAKTNIFIGTSYFVNLREHYTKQGNNQDSSIKLALAAYNYGMGNVGTLCEENIWTNCRVDSFPEETKKYIANVLGYYDKFTPSVST
jgi:hypothetical protein